VLAWAAVAFGAAFAVALYDNAWRLGAWAQPGPTLVLVMTLALPPLAACAYAAGHELPRAAGVLVVSLGWIGYVAVPSVRSWGPAILILLACGVVLHRLGSGRPGRARLL
jgi:hypothetical protein